MQRLGRCPRCGYVLRFDGQNYTCDFCGYPHAHRSLMTTVHDVERNLKSKDQGLFEGFRRPRQVYVYYPIAVRPCTACGVNIPLAISRCPSCGATQQATQAARATGNSPIEPQGVDRKVFDYIVAHNATISMSQATLDLSLSQDVLQSSIERLKSSGLLSQT